MTDQSEVKVDGSLTVVATGIDMYRVSSSGGQSTDVLKDNNSNEILAVSQLAKESEAGVYYAIPRASRKIHEMTSGEKLELVEARAAQIKAFLPVPVASTVLKHGPSGRWTARLLGVGGQVLAEVLEP